MFPKVFLHQIGQQLGAEVAQFENALATTPPTSIRLNPAKSKLLFPDASSVPWHPHGWYLPKRPVFTLDPAFHAGAYYVQEAASMLVGHAISSVYSDQASLKVLDLCAAPGGKSTLVLSQLSSDSLLVSNEVIKSRYRTLTENIRKWGLPNVAIVNHDPKDFQGITDFFDVLLIDAPCSGEGLFRKDEKAIREWSPKHVQFCSIRQQRIIKDALATLKNNGYLIYCTCTYNDTENRENVAWMVSQYGLKSVKLNIPKAWGIVEKEQSKQFGYQCYPHKLAGEGFFISVLQKTDLTPESKTYRIKKKLKNTFLQLTKLTNKKRVLLNKWIANPEQYEFFETPSGTIRALPKSLIEAFLYLDKQLKVKQFGVPIGTFKRDDFVPTHELALSTIIAPDLPAVEVDKKNALLYLKKEKMEQPFSQKGWHLVRHQGLNLGWIKVISNRVNNYLPKEYRIRMSIDE